MTEVNEIYKCEICGNVVEVIENGAGTLVCCGEDMKLLQEKTVDEGKEKHVPVIEVDGKKVTVKVGDTPHPMEEKHYIMQIEVLADGKVLASYKPSPGEKPEATWELEKTDNLSARAYCNVHGLWKSA